jgi:hypothetical protein
VIGYDFDGFEVSESEIVYSMTIFGKKYMSKSVGKGISESKD